MLLMDNSKFLWYRILISIQSGLDLGKTTMNFSIFVIPLIQWHKILIIFMIHLQLIIFTFLLKGSFFELLIIIFCYYWNCYIFYCLLLFYWFLNKFRIFNRFLIHIILLSRLLRSYFQLSFGKIFYTESSFR